MNALTPGTTPNPGHSIQEIAPPTGCSNQQVLKFDANGGKWYCDNDAVGITAESDPTVAASVKDGVDWTELTGIPAGFSDGVDNVNDADADPTNELQDLQSVTDRGASTTNAISVGGINVGSGGTLLDVYVKSSPICTGHNRKDVGCFDVNMKDVSECKDVSNGILTTQGGYCENWGYCGSLSSAVCDRKSFAVGDSGHCIEYCYWPKTKIHIKV